jgi:hypothetical protein
MAISQVEVLASSGAPSSAKNSVTFGTQTGAGELVVAFVFVPYNNTATITDNLSQTYTELFSSTSAGGQNHTYLFYCANSQAGVTTLTVTTSSSATDNRGGVIVGHYAGMATTSVVDQSDPTPTSASGTPWSSDNVTTTNASDLLIGTCAASINSWGGTNGTPSGGTGWTLDAFLGGANASIDGGNGAFMALSHRIVSSAGAQANTGTTSSGTTTFNHYPGIVAFKGASAASIAIPVLLASLGEY